MLIERLFHVNNGNRKRFDVCVKALTVLGAHSIRIKRTWERGINERHLMGITCTCEGGIHRFTLLENAIRLNSIRQCLSGHKLWESRRDTPDNNRILLKIKSFLFNFSPPPGVYGIFLLY
jgi:hypothetical protein